MILVICTGVGLLLRVTSGKRLSDLSRVNLHGETMLLGLLVAQALPSAMRLDGQTGRVAFAIWLATFPCLIVVAWLNRRSPGMLLLGVGLFLNLTVIALNGGMPVWQAAIAAMKPGAGVLVIAGTDFVHVLGTSATRLPWLADVIPVAGPSWLRSVASPGDCLLFAGIVAFLASAAPSQFRNPGTS